MRKGNPILVFHSYFDNKSKSEYLFRRLGHFK